jgi:hypothetical protein
MSEIKIQNIIMNRFLIILVLVSLLLANQAKAQSTTGAGAVSSAVPFLTIAPDSRGGAIGDAGAATSPDVNSQYWNPAKYAFATSTSGLALLYTPWLRNLVDDMNLAYLVGYHQIDDLQTFSGSLRYFDLGSMRFYDNAGNELPGSNPNEFSVDMAYALKLSDNWSGSVALRYILSDIFSGTSTIPGNNVDMRAGHAFASDVAFYYNKTFFQSRKESNIAFGVNISNIGSKISYDGGNIKDFIPTNLRIGTAYSTEIDKFNKMSFAFDINKLLIPTPPFEMEEGKPVFNNLGNKDINPIEGIFKSFTDSPGGFSEELQELTFSLGAEYWYSNQFALRTGYFHEHKDKCDRKFLTFGAGLKMNVFSLDFSYIFTLRRQSPLENTLRFTLGFDLQSFNSQGRNRR